MQLAAGVLDRSCTPWYLQRPHIILCPDASGKESLCDPIKSAENAESWQAVAAGVYFSSQCQRAIAISNDVPTVPVATTKKRDSSALLSIPQTAGAIRTETKHAARSLVTLMRVKRTSTTTASSTCPIYSDYYIWDLGEEVLSFTGYVHFGDSFAAGMGTGTTSWDSCRVGSNNYGQLLYSYMNDSSIPFENYACSGDTTTGLANQVKRWTDTTSPNIGTVTIGGNDVGFSDIIRNCLLREMPWSTQWYEAECEANKETARLIMNDTSSTGLTYKLKEAYLSILSASDNNNFMLYVTGYVGFFNYDTTICNLSTFQYWWPAYNPSIPETENTPFLTTDVRVELDALVDQMNGVIQQAVNDANSLYGSTSVTYVDIQPYFDTHRWCEAGVYEPDSGRGETFFFLSGWDDFVHEHDELVRLLPLYLS
jgi:lysophospholipase L1-like esterase